MLSTCENQKHRQDLLILAEELFDLSIHKLDYGLTRIRFHLGWSFFEFFRQLLVLRRDEHFHDKNLILYSGLWAPRTISTACYVRDRANYLRNFCSCLNKKIETKCIYILQHILLFQKSMPLNPTYAFCSAVRANFFCNALCDYRKALNLCKEVFKRLRCSSERNPPILFADFISFPLRSKWCGLYDEHIQAIFGFLTLHRALTAPAAARKRMTPFYVSCDLYLEYIYTRCCMFLNEQVMVFGFGDPPVLPM